MMCFAAWVLIESIMEVRRDIKKYKKKKKKEH